MYYSAKPNFAPGRSKKIFFVTVYVKCGFTFLKFFKLFLRPLYRKISFDTRAKNDSTLV